MKKPPLKSLSDLRPGLTIQCFVCSETKPDAGSRRFRAHKVCEACVAKVQAKDHRQSQGGIDAR